MIKNLVGQSVEFDLKSAKKLEDRLDRWINEGNLLPFELSDLLFSTWGYAAALAEIKYLRKELNEFERESEVICQVSHICQKIILMI